MPQPIVYVLVINWNGLEHLEACFESLCRIPLPNVRFLLVDNASSDGSVAFVRERFSGDARVEFLELPENMGWSKGNNAGIRHAMARDAEYCFLLNNDTSVAEDSIAQMLQAALDAPDLGAIAPKMVLFDHPHILNSVGLICSIIGAAWDRGIGRHDFGQHDTPENVIGVCGGAMFLKVAALRATGLFPEDFDIYLDDLDLCLRLRAAGFGIRTCPQAVVRHKFSATLGSGAWGRYKYYLNTRNRFRLMLRNFPAAHALEILPAVFVGECRAIGDALRSGAPWRVWAHMRSWGAALLYLPSALRARREFSINGKPGAAIWPLVVKRPYFCPRVELPSDGWYGERECAGRRLRAAGKQASLFVHAGQLRIHAGNCYPALGSAQVRVWQGDSLLLELATTKLVHADLTISCDGWLRFEAERLFTAEETGESVDIGAWIAVTSQTAPANPSTPGV